jgi:hypothetical protein
MAAAAALTTWEAECSSEHLARELQEALESPRYRLATIPADPKATLFVAEWLRENHATMILVAQSTKRSPGDLGDRFLYRIERFVC